MSIGGVGVKFVEGCTINSYNRDDMPTFANMAQCTPSGGIGR